MKRTQVAAAVIQRPDGTFLLGQRGPNTFYAGYWEFPGGKVENGETPADALVRELREELGIVVRKFHPWLVREHRYEHAHVRLHFFRVVEWDGELQDHVHSALSWQRVDALNVAPMLPANARVLSALALPDIYAITDAGHMGIERQLALLRSSLEGGLRLLQVREPELPEARRVEFAIAAVALCRQFGARVLINGDPGLARESGADGLHLSSRQLMGCDARPDFSLVAASCHDRAELDRAAVLELDFVALGAVRETASHPGQKALGWAQFHQLIGGFGLPVYALGGMRWRDLEAAWQAGAHGIAAIRGAWTQGD